MATGAGRGADEDSRGDEDVDEITRGVEKVRVGNTNGRSFVYFQLDTTGFEGNSHIIRIAACSDQDDEPVFNKFVLPKIDITLGAQRYTGITCNDQRMFHDGQEKNFLTITQALLSFIEFLTNQPSPVVLFCHDSRGFHCPRLLNALQACNLDEQFNGAVHHFVDTLPLFKEINKKEKKHKLPTLYTYYTGQVLPRAHAGMEDVRALRRIVDEANPGHELFKRHSFTFEDVRNAQRERQERQASPWTELVNRDVISEHIRDKLFMSGLPLDEVRQVFRTEGQGENAVRVMLKERGRLQIRHIDAIVRYLHGEMADNP